MREIIFSNLVLLDGYIRCKYQDSINSGILKFDLEPAINPGNDLVAIALSTLCGRGNYTSIYFDFPLQSKTIEKIKLFCYCDIKVLSVLEDEVDKIKTTNVLSFSGGFDSLATKYIMPYDTKLVSMDFSGKFARERTFFEQFDTHIVSTNLLDTSLRYNSWSFMGIASILFSDYLGAKYHTFGSILEAGSNNLSKLPVAAKNITFPPFAAANMINAPYAIGITEVGTAMIVLNYAPELAKSALESLANNGEVKKYRKQLITSIVAKRLNIDFQIEFDTPNNKLSFGKSFADDFISFYFLKYAGIDALGKMMTNIPQEMVALVDKLSLNFFERINTKFLEHFPIELLPGMLERVSAANIIPYTEEDWAELNQVIDILRVYYKF